MSKVLMIRHLPTSLPFQDKKQLLQHFGAENVWETTSKRNYLFASFGSVDKAKASMLRLHQLEIAKRRLVVEYSFEKEQVNPKDKDKPEETSTATKLLKKAVRLLNAWNPSVDFYQPPPPHLKYKYPDLAPENVVNIVYALFTHKPFNTQVLHLMNKMCLSSPFLLDPEAVTFFKEKFKRYFTDEIQNKLSSESESEISSDETIDRPQHLPRVVKRKRKLPVPSRKRPAPPPSNTPKVRRVVNQEEVFEQPAQVQEPKKIQLVVHRDALQKPTEEPDVIGEIGKFQNEEQPKETDEPPPEPELPVITMSELMKNRLSHHNMKVLPLYKNYHPGEPSMRLYIKNLAKTVTEQDVKSIYKLFVQGHTDEELTGFDVRVMQEGRMKGQAFVTFPSENVAERALEQTNGYMLKGKPMVVQFARAANKKTIE